MTKTKGTAPRPLLPRDFSLMSLPVGGGRLCFSVHGVDGILQYDMMEMSFSCGECSITFHGTDMECRTYRERTVEVTGRICAVYFGEVQR